MSAIDEGNIATTIVLIKRHIEATGKVPPILDLTAHDEIEFGRALRDLAIKHLEKAEAYKQTMNTLHVTGRELEQVQSARGGNPLRADDA